MIALGEGRKEYAGSGICVIFVSDADAVYNEYLEKEVAFIVDIADRDYDSRDFRVKDNNVNI